jgi:Polyketide cyclase / dehydrase and lipid transport
MWQHQFETTTDLTPERIWPVIADVAAWGQVDHNIDYVAVDGTPKLGTKFTLKPKGGPTLRFEIGKFEPPLVYSDICKMPFAKMETEHRIERGAKTRVVVTITIAGPLAPLWGLVVGRKHAAGLPAQTERIIARARQNAVI